MNAPSLPVQRVFAVLLLLVLIGAVSLAIGLPLRKAHAHYDEAIADAEARLSRLQRISAQRTENSKLLDALKQKDPSKFFLKNSAANLAGAELQDAVRAAVEGQGGRISSVQIGQPREDQGHRVYVVNATFSASSAALQKTLHALESREPFVFVDTLVLRSTVFPGAKPVPGREPDITVQIEASAYAQTPAAAAAAAAAAKAEAAAQKAEAAKAERAAKSEAAAPNPTLDASAKAKSP